MGNTNNKTNSVIDVNFIRKNKIPTNMNRLLKYNNVIIDYIKDKESQINIKFLTEFNKCTSDLLNEWDNHARNSIIGDIDSKKKARHWFENGEGRRGIIQEIDTICDVFSLYH